jgi:nicotinate-nucleotide adenylyltransferase
VVVTDEPSSRVPAALPWGIMGGTFDPIHLGHLAVAERARESLGLAGVVFIPAARNPLKTTGPAGSAADRVAMVELAVAGNERFRVSRMELERDGPSYTVDTLEALHADGRYAGDGLPDPLLILSVEAVRRLPEWHRVDRILELARIVVVPRRGYPPFDLGALGTALPGRTSRFVALDGPDLGHSSTEIRARVAEGRSVRYLVPDAVEAWIARHGVYGAPGADGGPWTR